MSELLCLVADTSVKLHLEPLAAYWLNPLAVDALVLVIGPGVLACLHLETLPLQARSVRIDTLRIASILILEGKPNRVGNKRSSSLWRHSERFHVVIDFFFDAIVAFETALKTY